MALNSPLIANRRSETPCGYNGLVPPTRILSLRAVELLVVAVVGGALALGGAALLGKLGSHTTIQQVSPLGGGGVGNVTLQAPTTGALTAEQIYKRDAPGVVQITATDPTQASPAAASRRWRRRNLPDPTQHQRLIHTHPPFQHRALNRNPVPGEPARNRHPRLRGKTPRRKICLNRHKQIISLN